MLYSDGLKRRLEEYKYEHERAMINEPYGNIGRMWALEHELKYAQRDRNVPESNEEIARAYFSYLERANDLQMIVSFVKSHPNIRKVMKRNDTHRAIRRFLHSDFWDTKIRGYHYSEEGWRVRNRLSKEDEAKINYSVRMYGRARVRRFFLALADHWFGYPRKNRLKPTGRGED